MKRSAGTARENTLSRILTDKTTARYQQRPITGSLSGIYKFRQNDFLRTIADAVHPAVSPAGSVGSQLERHWRSLTPLHLIDSFECLRHIILNMIRETSGDNYEAARSINQQLTFEHCSAFFKKRRLDFGPQ